MNIGHMTPGTLKCCRRADQLMAEDNDEAVPYCVATGEIKKLVTFFRGRGQLLEALIIAQVHIIPTSTALKRLGMISWMFAFRERVKGTSAHPKTRRSTTPLTTWMAGNITRGSAFIYLCLQSDCRSAGHVSHCCPPFL